MHAIGKKFSFTSSGLSGDTFEVVSFAGTEGLSRLYRFDITLVSDDDELDLENVIQSRATLSILRDEGNIRFNGILSEFEQMGTALEKTHYRAVLTPAFWRQTLTHHNQVFFDKTVPQIIEAAMKDGGLTSLDYEFRLTGNYPAHEYVCQYNESHYNFIARLMEREGIYYFFEQGEYGEKVIVTDSALLHSVMEEGGKMYYSPLSGLDESAREEVIKTVMCSQKMLPARVVLKDYNYRTPSVDMKAECVVSERGVGDVYIYGEHFSTTEEGTRLATVRAEALKCRARVYHGESLIPYLRPGYIFNLDGHNRKDFNVSYLTTDITHNGDQSFMFSAGIDKVQSTHEKSSYYRNSFTAISSESQFRPERITEKPRISGTLNAHIDAEGSCEYAELDEQGRYKVRMPFDLADSGGGKASSWLRMAQPYAGSDHGMHFPLHKETEVLITFIDGDPDRPLIAAAVPNPRTPTPVTRANQTTNIIHSAAGNRMEMEDENGSERVRLSSPHMNSFLHMGAPVIPLFGASSVGAAFKQKADGNHFALSTDGTGLIHAGQNLTVEANTFMETKVGNVPTPPTTATFFGAAAGTVAAPATGDYYLTTKANHVHNVGVDTVIQVAGKYSESITGTKSVHVKSDADETFDKNLTQVIGTDLTQTITGKLHQTVKGTMHNTCWGDQSVDVTGTGKHTYGAKENLFAGASQDTFLGAFDAVYIGARCQIHVGSNNMINLIDNNTINMGLIFSLVWALKIEFEYSVGIKVGTVRVNENHLEMKKSTATITDVITNCIIGSLSIDFSDMVIM